MNGLTIVYLALPVTLCVVPAAINDSHGCGIVVDPKCEISMDRKFLCNQEFRIYLYLKVWHKSMIKATLLQLCCIGSPVLFPGM